jgi:hypothetical protein
MKFLRGTQKLVIPMATKILDGGGKLLKELQQPTPVVEQTRTPRARQTRQADGNISPAIKQAEALVALSLLVSPPFPFAAAPSASRSQVIVPLHCCCAREPHCLFCPGTAFSLASGAALLVCLKTAFPTSATQHNRKPHNAQC